MLAHLKYEQITGLNAVKTLSPPPGAQQAVVVCTGQAVRYRADGEDPSATVGMLIATNTEKVFRERLQSLRFIESAASAVLNVSYYAEE